MNNWYGLLANFFKNPFYSIAYWISFLVLFAHLYHGSSSFFRTFGIYLENQKLVKRLGLFYSLSVCLGFASVPFYFFIFYLRFGKQLETMYENY